MKKKTLAQLKKALWNECKRITRQKHGDVCYTCGATGLVGANWHTGHGKPKGALSLKYQYDLRNLRPQCMRCNKHLGGMTDLFIARLETEKHGMKFLSEACVMDGNRWVIKRIEPMTGGEAYEFVEKLLEEYKQM